MLYKIRTNSLLLLNDNTFMEKEENIKTDFRFEVGQSDWSELLGKTHFTSDVSIIKCTSGQAVITINSQQHVLRANISFLLIEFALFQVLEVSEDFKVTYCRLSLELCNEIYTHLDDRVLEVTQHSAPDIYTEESLHAADLIFRSICHLYENKSHAYRNQLLINLAISYAYELYEITNPFVDKQVERMTHTHVYIINHFYDLIFEYHLQNRHVGFYATTLNITERYLHKIVKGTLGITPKQMIDFYMIALIKKMLLTTSLTFQQIADKLNYPDQSALGQFFRRNTEMTLSDFRNSYTLF